MKKSFIEHCNEYEKEYGMCPRPTTDKEALEFLYDYLLDEGWYTTFSMGHDQVNTEIVATILNKYSEKYRKECEEYNKKRGGKQHDGFWRSFKTRKRR